MKLVFAADDDGRKSDTLNRGHKAAYGARPRGAKSRLTRPRGATFLEKKFALVAWALNGVLTIICQPPNCRRVECRKAAHTTY